MMEELSFVNVEDMQRPRTPSPAPISSSHSQSGSVDGGPAQFSANVSHSKPPSSPGGSVDSYAGMSRGSETARSVKSSRSHKSGGDGRY
jgi:hypothetical protein